MKWIQGKSEDGSPLGCWTAGEHYMLVPNPTSARQAEARNYFAKLLEGLPPAIEEERAEETTEPPTTESLSASP
jgi:hypothetical protein